MRDARSTRDRGSRRRNAAVIAVFALIAGACSGYPSDQLAQTAAVSGAEDAESTSSAASAGRSGQSGSPGSPGTGSGTSVGRGTGAPGPGGTGARSGGGSRWPSAGLFTPEEDRIGITDDEIRICMHAPFIFGELFDNRPEDETIYWDKLNAEEGGIYGRKVTMTFTDDQYQPSSAIQAAEQCKSQDPFFIMAGIGFDQTPAVREWAEQNRMLYLYAIATEKGAEGKRYSFTSAPSVEQLGRILAQWVLKKYPSERVAVVYRISDNWNGGREAFISELEAAGKEVVADIGVDANQSVYQEEIRALQAANAEVVFFHENALNWLKMIPQARNQGYTPRWIGEVGFNLVTDTLGGDVLDPPAQVAWVTPSFDRTNPDLPWAKEIDRLEAAYEKYHPDDKEPNDVDWMFWLAMKGVHDMLLDCGPACTRNTLAGMLETDYQGIVPPLCPADFSRGHLAGYQANIFEAVPRGSGSVWENVATCKAGF